jgi:hypothetical protein
MKKIPFPKGTRDITCYLLKDGIGFSIEVRVGLGGATKYVRATGVLRTGTDMTGGSPYAWYLKADVKESGSGYLDASELLKIVRVNYRDNRYSENGSYHKMFGSRGESLCIHFDKGHKLEGLDFGEIFSHGGLKKCAFLAPTCDEFVANESTVLGVAFDVTLADLKGAAK